jgi:hypothetical protein
VLPLRLFSDRARSRQETNNEKSNSEGRSARPGTKEGAGSGQAWAVGDKVYWDDTNKRFTKTSTSNTLAGYAVAAALTADVVGRLRLCPAA